MLFDRANIHLFLFPAIVNMLNSVNTQQWRGYAGKRKPAALLRWACGCSYPAPSRTCTEGPQRAENREEESVSPPPLVPAVHLPEFIGGGARCETSCAFFVPDAPLASGLAHRFADLPCRHFVLYVMVVASRTSSLPECQRQGFSFSYFTPMFIAPITR